MSNWGLPTLTDLYTNIISYLTGRDEDAVRMNDTRAASATNLPTYAKRWNNTNGCWEYWNGSVYVPMALSIAGGGTGQTSAANARTALDVYSKAQVDSAIDVDVAAHSNQYSGIHGATSSLLTSRIIQRDSYGRAYVATPIYGGQIATKDYVDNKAGLAGTYDPTFTAGANISVIIDTTGAMWTRSGNFVHVSGRAVLHTSSGNPDTTTYIFISLPYSSNFVSEKNLSGGVSVWPSGSGMDSGYITGDVAGKRAKMQWRPSTSGDATLYYWFTYQVL